MPGFGPERKDVVVGSEGCAVGHWKRRRNAVVLRKRRTKKECHLVERCMPQYLVKRVMPSTRSLCELVQGT